MSVKTRVNVIDFHTPDPKDPTRCRALVNLYPEGERPWQFIVHFSRHLDMITYAEVVQKDGDELRGPRGWHDAERRRFTLDLEEALKGRTPTTRERLLCRREGRDHQTEMTMSIIIGSTEREFTIDLAYDWQKAERNTIHGPGCPAAPIDVVGEITIGRRRYDVPDWILEQFGDEIDEHCEGPQPPEDD